MPGAISLNLYEILGIYRNSATQYSEVSVAEIKQNYHSSLLSHHPDKQQQFSSQQAATSDKDTKTSHNANNFDVNQIEGASISDLSSAKNPDITIPAIKTAYLILSNPERRQEYDLNLKLGGDGGGVTGSTGKSKAPKAANDQIDLDDMECKVEMSPDGITETCTWTRACRCGEDEGYILNEIDLEENGADSTSITVQCVGCSLWIEVLYAVEE